MHLLAVKTRAVSVWDHGPLSSNIMMVYGVLVALGIMLFVVYVPGVCVCMLAPSPLPSKAQGTDWPVSAPQSQKGWPAGSMRPRCLSHRLHVCSQVDTAFGTYARLSALYFLPSLASGALLIAWGETRKAMLRNLYAREEVWGEVEERSWFYKCFAW